MHGVVLGKAATGYFHLMNKTPTMWYSKEQATSKTATYGSEFIACTVEDAVDKILIYIILFVTLEYRYVIRAIPLVVTMDKL